MWRKHGGQHILYKDHHIGKFVGKVRHSIQDSTISRDKIYPRIGLQAPSPNDWRVNPCEPWVPERGDWQSDHLHGAPSVPWWSVTPPPPPGRTKHNPYSLLDLAESEVIRYPSFGFWVVSVMELTDIRKHLLWLQQLHYMYLSAMHIFNRLAYEKKSDKEKWVIHFFVIFLAHMY